MRWPAVRGGRPFPQKVFLRVVEGGHDRVHAVIVVGGGLGLPSLVIVGSGTILRPECVGAGPGGLSLAVRRPPHRSPAALILASRTLTQGARIVTPLASMAFSIVGPEAGDLGPVLVKVSVQVLGIGVPVTVSVVSLVGPGVPEPVLPLLLEFMPGWQGAFPGGRLV